MGLNTRGRGRGRISANFLPEVPHRGQILNQRTIFRPAQPGFACPPVAFPPMGPCGVPTTTGGPARFNFPSPRHSFGKFSGKYYKKSMPHRPNDPVLQEIDLTKPWVTEEIRAEENKKQEILELWKKTKVTENWNAFEVQKQNVHKLYEKAKMQYAASHPNEAALWESNSSQKQYFCESCDKSFRTNDDFLLHKAEHETCGRDGCEFIAHPKIIAKHIKMQHDTGLYKRIGKLYTEEDISKWIEERKKRYPTRKLIEEKKLLEQEKINRGEKIKEDNSKFNKSFGHKGKRKGKQNIEKNSTKHTRSRRTRKKKHVPLLKNCFEEEMSSIRKGVPAFLGINSLNESLVPEKKDCDISDDEWEMENKTLNTPKPLLNSSLGLLATLYDSDVEFKNEEPHTGVVSADEGSGPEEVTSKNPVPEQNSVKEKVSLKRKPVEKKSHEKRKRQNTLTERDSEQRSLTLLEKLLKNEIRHERNVILQCVHFVVKNNFFKT